MFMMSKEMETVISDAYHMHCLVLKNIRQCERSSL